MTTHMIWSLIGFGIAMFFVGVYQVLKRRGIKFLWYHPLFAGVLILFILYLLQSLFADLSESEVLMNWNMMLILGFPLVIVAAVFFYRAYSMRRKQ